MKTSILIVGLNLLLTLLSCNSDRKIEKLLTSSNKEEIIFGAYLAGESKKRKFIPMLLANAEDARISTNKKFLGISVYQSKMIALKKIFEKEPPEKITYKIDLSVIEYYKSLYNKN